MRRLTTFVLCACVLFCLGTAARANILILSCAGTGSCDDVTWNPLTWSESESSGSVNAGVQYSTLTQTMSGIMTTSVSADSTSDPTLSYTDTATNDNGPSGPSWSGYYIWLAVATPGTLSSDPTFTGATVITPSAGWFPSSNSGTLTYAGTSSGGFLQPPRGWAEYVGTITLNDSPPIPGTGPNNNLVFSYSLNFEGSTQYDVYQVQTPAMAVVPEPSTMALLAGGCGVILFGSWRRWRR